MTDVLVLTATDFEQSGIMGRLDSTLEQTVSGRRWTTGLLADRRLWLVEAGLGAVNTASALTAALEFERPQLVLQVGVGGAYPGSGLGVGDAALATEEIYGDVGVHTIDGWLPATEIGIPLLRQNGEYYNRFPLDPALVEWARRAVVGRGRPCIAGPFVTAQECSGTGALGGERAVRFGAVCENMEGAAAAHICRLYGVSFVEMRCMSNQVENRCRDEWDLAGAAAGAQAAGLDIVANLEAMPEPNASEEASGR